MKTADHLPPDSLSSLSEQQCAEIYGGAFPWLASAIIALVVSAINSFGDIREGLVDGWNGTSRYPQ